MSGERESVRREGEGHETRDFKPLYVVAFVGILVYAVVVVYLLSWTIFDQLKAPGESPTANANLFPQPRLQIDPQTEMSEMQARERELLTTYGWVDRNTGTVRIPIERAMEIAVERGLK